MQDKLRGKEYKNKDGRKFTCCGLKTSHFLRALTALLVIGSLALVFQSSKRMSLTIDESTHYYCGLQWWQEGQYNAWPENPLLSHIIPAAGAYFQGFRGKDFDLEGDDVSYWDHFLHSYNSDYFHATDIAHPLLWIRIPVMLMFLLSMVIVWVWSHRLSGEWGALIATGFYAFTPLLMGHAGVATTDVTFTAAFVLLLWTFFRWINAPTLLNGLWFGIGLALAMLSKFTVLPFFGLAMPVAFFLRAFFGKKIDFLPAGKWVQTWLPSGLLATGVMALVIWAFHGFHVGAIGAEPVVRTLIREGMVSPRFAQIIVPAPEWFAGILVLLEHNRQGMVAYLFGELSNTGFWYFYPAGITLKTPIPALIMGLVGIAGLVRLPRREINWEVAATFFIPFALMVSVMFSNINIGIRHVMAIYPLFAIGATASALAWLKTLRQGDRLATYIPAGLLSL